MGDSMKNQNVKKFLESVSAEDIARRVQDKMLHSTPAAEVGRFTYGNPKFVMFPSSSRANIGSFCSFADDVTLIMGGEHFVDRITTSPLNMLLGDMDLPWLETERGKIVIGNDVWVGYGATILSGVTIGNGAVIGARTVVASDVEPYSIVVGNPARLLRKRFNQETIDHLENVAWWDWDIEKIRSNAGALLQPPRLPVEKC